MKVLYSLILAVTTTAYPWEERFNPISMQNQMPNFNQFGGNNLGGGVSPDSPGTQPIDDNGATDIQIGNGAGIGHTFDIGGGDNGGNGDGSVMNGDDSFYNPYQIGRGSNDDNGQGMNGGGEVWQIGNGVGMGGGVGVGMGGGMGGGGIAGQGMGDYDTGDDMGDNGRWKRQTVDVENGMIGGSAGIRRDNQGSGYNPMRMQNQIPNFNQISANNGERHGVLAFTSNDGSNGYQIGNGAGIGPNYDIGGGNNGGNGGGRGGDDSFYNPYQIGQGTGIMGRRRKRETSDMGNVLIGRNTGMRLQRMQSGMVERI